MLTETEDTTGGSYFVSNYPPYSFWSPERVGEAYAALDRAPAPGTALGIYLHIPFCRKRCHFCYFKVYTDKNADEIESYLDAAIQELTLYSQKPFIGGRKPSFYQVYTLMYCSMQSLGLASLPGTVYMAGEPGGYTR